MIDKEVENQKKLYNDIMKILESDPANRIPLAVSCLGGAYAVELVCRGAIDQELRKVILSMVNNSMDLAELHINKIKEGIKND